MDTSKIGRDIWIRASHNKLAHECAASSAHLGATIWSWVVAALVAIPTGCTAWALVLLSTGASQASPEYRQISLFAVVFGVAAIVIAVANPVRSHEEKSRRHLELSHNYGSIAQRTRRLDGQVDGQSDEAQWLVDLLQNDMEMQKNAGSEASSADFAKARKRLKELRPHPFGICPEDFD